MSFDSQGFEIIDDVLSAQAVKQLLDSMRLVQVAPQRGGVRQIDVLCPEVGQLAHSSHLHALAQRYLQGKARFVRAIYFIKSPEHNWLVPWHQDSTVAVTARFDLPDWGPWACKAGVWHVQPPLQVLEKMVTVRIHLDNTTKDNGCLKIAASTHRLGLVDSAQIRAHVESSDIHHCELKAGAALVMRPHVLHASTKSVSQAPRRVLHFEYSSFDLPRGIAWRV